MNVAIYSRVSTSQQAEHGYSLETQIDACRKKALELGATSIKEYTDDGYSGAYLERPKLDELRDAVAQKLHDVIIIYDIDRLSRDTMHLLLLTEEFEKNAKLVYVNSEYSRTPEGQLFFEIRGSFAKYERVKIQDRFQRGKRGKLRRGLPISDHHVFGYSWDGQNYILNPAQAEIVRAVFDQYVNHIGGVQAVVNWLHDRGIPSPQGREKWSSNAVCRLLHQRMYTGEYYAYMNYHKKVSAKKFEYIPREQSEWIPMTCPSIVSQELFDTAERKMNRNRTQKIHETNHIAMLSGVLYCADCGRKMLPVWNSKRTHRYYQCFSRIQKTPCKNHVVGVDVLDAMVWKILKTNCRTEAMLKKYIAQNQPKEKDNTDAIKKQLESIETKRQAVMNWFSANLITAEESTQKLTALKKQEQTLAEKLKTKKADIPTEKIVEDARQKFTPEEKRQFVLNYISKVIVLRKDFVNRYDVDLDITIIFGS